MVVAGDVRRVREGGGAWARKTTRDWLREIVEIYCCIFRGRFEHFEYESSAPGDEQMVAVSYAATLKDKIQGRSQVFCAGNVCHYLNQLTSSEGRSTQHKTAGIQ